MNSLPENGAELAPVAGAGGFHQPELLPSVKSVEDSIERIFAQAQSLAYQRRCIEDELFFPSLL